jgi:GTP-binding protein HflX
MHLFTKGAAVLSDTVGFVRKLPPVLVEAFQATLEELHQADLLLHVVDASSTSAADQIRVVDEVLSGMGLAPVPRVLVLNKCDLIAGETLAGVPADLTPATVGAGRYVVTSATKLIGIEELRLAIAEGLGIETAQPAR